MSILSNKTERKAMKVLANTLRFFSNTDLLFVSNDDAFKAREAEDILRVSSNITAIKPPIPKVREPN